MYLMFLKTIFVSYDKTYFYGFRVFQNFSKGIKITATTPSSTAVRLETGSINLEVSNNEPAIVTKRESSGNGESKLCYKDRFLTAICVAHTCMYCKRRTKFHLELRTFFQKPLPTREGDEKIRSPLYKF